MKRFLSLFLLLALQLGCSHPEPSSNPIQTMNDYPVSIEISKYRSDSIKAQPELISVLSERDEIQKTVNQLKETAETVSINDVDSQNAAFYVIKLLYNQGEQQNFLWIAEKNAVKSIAWNKEYDFEQFTDKEKINLIHLAGEAGWHSLKNKLLP